MRLLVAIGFWVVPIILVVLFGDDMVALLSLSLWIAYAIWNVKCGRKWYGVFLLLVPIYHFVLVANMFWAWAGQLTGDKGVPKSLTWFDTADEQRRALTEGGQHE
jgi:hypothetical protein